MMRKIPDVFIFKKLWYKIYGGCLLYCRQNGQKIYRDFGDFFVVGVENGVGGRGCWRGELGGVLEDEIVCMFWISGDLYLMVIAEDC